MAFQGYFIATDVHVVVRHHKLSDKDSLKPGKVLKPGDLRMFHMRSLFRRKVIGKLDSPWANEILGRLKAQTENKSVNKEHKKPGRKPKKATSEAVNKLVKK